MANKSIQTNYPKVLRMWNSLDELRSAALGEGCTPAQFAYAVEIVGSNPRHVAAYLKRHEFMGAAER
jgi:hypothetical protein